MGRSFFALCLSPSLASAQPPDDVSPEPAAETASAEPEASPNPAPTEALEVGDRVRRLDERRRSVRALIGGQLDPEVDVDALLSIELSGDALLGADDLVALRDALEEPPARPRSSRRKPTLAPDPDSETEAQARSRFVEALADWLRLDPEQRAERLAAHREASVAAERRRTELRARLERARQRRAQLDAFVAGTLDPEVDPASVLRLSLLEGLESAGASETSALHAEVEQAEQALHRAQRALLERPADERSALLDAHRLRQAAALEPEAEVEPEPEAEELEAVEPEAAVAEAEEAAMAVAREKARALAEARAAQTEARRALAEELARLLGVKEAQAHFELELAEHRLASSQRHEEVETWEQRSADVVDAIAAFAEPAEDPDSLYPLLREQLATARNGYDQVLRDVAQGNSNVPQPGALLELGDEVDPTEIRELHRELVAAGEQLSRREQQLQWTVADGYRADIARLEAARLSLLQVLSPSLRGQVTGFGPAGVRQVTEEASQIALELRYRGLSLPRQLRAVVADLRTSPVPLIMGVLQLLALVFVFRWWRRRAPEILAEAQRPPEPAPGRSRPRRAGWIASIAWYLSRIRKPLEWLVIAAVLFHATSLIELFPELELLWLVVLWLLLGSVTILFVDAIAARENRRQGGPSETADVRIRSLRLIGLSIAYTGLVLSLANALVGRGAIYSWVLGTCWLLAIPITLLLTRWWKDYIFAAYAKESEGRLVDWVRARTRGWASYPAAMVGGVVLLARGSWRWLVRRAARFDGTRKVLAYLFRRQVARQAEVTEHSESVTPAEPELQASFVQPVGSDDRLPEVAEQAMNRLCDTIGRPSATFSLVVGERGLGKSTLLSRVAEQHDGPTLALSCPSSGLPALVAELARALELDEASTLEQVGEALRDGGPRLVTLDDIQRLVQPTIGGMRGLDDLGRLARLSGEQVSWIGTIGAAAWQYVSRARGERLHFDDVITLGPWNEDDICALMRRRSERLEVEPSFDGLVIPRQYDDDELEQERRSEIGYYRILWDYARGNPHVASFFWAQSLFRDRSGQLVVRLFREPPAAELDALPLTLQFVLRSLVQLETATKPEVSAAIRMPPAEAEDALRFALGRGYVVQEHGVFSITWPWYRAITAMLQRQHLLAA